ncbi:MAG: DNA polymerase I, partial [Candidatus Cloacimonetes bacterium]|nr:DNA polymerase I [Candidatus Cloacimonadota bacterium]
MDKTLYLIDGTALLYRAYYAFIRNPLINSKGQNTSAIFGVVNSFLHFLDKLEPRHIIISFDRKEPTFRHERSALYKANRPPMPDDLISQVEPVMEFFRLIQVPEVAMEGYEADDVLATLAERYKRDHRIVIVTGDKDYSQIVEEAVTLFDPMKNMTIDRQEVIRKYGITPEQFIDYLALIGDASDNIPGVKGIGPKTAENLLSQYQTLDNIYANLGQLPDKVREKLITHREDAYLSQDLACICRQVPVEILIPPEFNRSYLAGAMDLLTEYEIPSLRQRLHKMLAALGHSPEPTPPGQNDAPETQADIFDLDGQNDAIQTERALRDTAPAHSAPFEARLVSAAHLDVLITELHNAPIISIDTETDSTDPVTAHLVGISFCTSDTHAWYIPLAHGMVDNVPLADLRPGMMAALAGKLLLGHNLKYDLIVLRRNGMILTNPIFDTMLAAYILDPGTNQYSLDNCAQKELSHAMIPISDLIGKGKNQLTFDLVDVQAACRYSAEDAWAVWRLYPIYRRKLDFQGLAPVYDNIDLPLIPVLQRMEETGVRIDPAVLSAISHQINLRLKELTGRIFQTAGYELNLNSPQQLAKLLFENLKLPVRKKTKTGMSTDIVVLEELSDVHPIADLLIEYRQLTKLEGTYVSALPRMTNPHTGRIHSSFNQTIASTGRLSSSNPNLQNIPIRTDIGREIRRAFIASDPDHLILAADYSQIELRLLALMSRDHVLLEAFAQDLDIHRQTAAYIAGKPLEQVTPEERRQAKVINFGILYGMGAVKLSRELDITQIQAKQIIANYFQRIPGIRSFIDHCIAQARIHRHSETLFGRRLYLPAIASSNSRLRSEAERIAVNMPIQGTAADLIKIAMINIHRRIDGMDGIKMILQVHDELIFEVHREQLEQAIPLTR